MCRDLKNGCACYECIVIHRDNGCDYGRADGDADYIKECDCEK